jgi:hypothetical protein
MPSLRAGKRASGHYVGCRNCRRPPTPSIPHHRVAPHLNLLNTGPTPPIPIVWWEARQHVGTRVARVQRTAAGSNPVLPHGDGLVDRKLQRLANLALLSIDDRGLRPVRGAERLCLLGLVRGRHERGSTVLTSNRAIPEWQPPLPELLVAMTTTDRLLAHAHVTALVGQSFRNPRAARAAGAKGRPDQPRRAARCLWPARRCYGGLAGPVTGDGRGAALRRWYSRVGVCTAGASQEPRTGERRAGPARPPVGRLHAASSAAASHPAPSGRFWLIFGRFVAPGGKATASRHLLGGRVTGAGSACRPRLGRGRWISLAAPRVDPPALPCPPPPGCLDRAEKPPGRTLMRSAVSGHDEREEKDGGLRGRPDGAGAGA